MTPSFATINGSASREVRTQRRLLEEFTRVRRQSLAIAEPLSGEDQTVQSMPDASPTKWHLAHTTWFFEAFILKPGAPKYRVFNEAFFYLFNSYYEALGPRHSRPHRGMLTRPSIEDVRAYRAYVDEQIARYVEQAEEPERETIEPLLILGLNHEQQHQELMLSDVLHLFSCNPLRPAYRTRSASRHPHGATAATWYTFAGGITEVGHQGDTFSFDNEGPRHVVVVNPFRLASRLVTNGEWKAFMADGGYQRPELWMSDGWSALQDELWHMPLYWRPSEGSEFQTLTLNGEQHVDDAAPICHISYYEADAFARWAGKRLPSEFEWEVAARDVRPVGNTLGSGALCPQPANAQPAPGRQADECPAQLFGDVWEWTASPYVAYPGYRPAAGALGEYNGKFMCNQMVMRGGSCVTPDGHIRATYRNFFYPHQRWQFSGLRLAEDA
ncbi:MAG: ergothioneine biosynthesis protein EgtB [Hyphomicrobiales bacterium]|nr:ergothioneine biosynthesis protein EgtB [Hyphomicrobiales bacterium]